MHRTVQEEERLAKIVRDSLRDDANRLAVLERRNEQRALAGTVSAGDPYFAHLTIQTQRGERDVLLGAGTLLDPRRGICLVDSRISPLARVCFRCAEGEEYEEEDDADGERVVAGTLLRKRFVAFRDGVLSRIETQSESFVRNCDGIWQEERSPIRFTAVDTTGVLADGRTGPTQLGTGAMVQPATTSIHLDEHQRSAVEAATDRSLLVLGDAGCGKTTVALHRLAWLLRKSDRRSVASDGNAVEHAGDPSRGGALVVVPEQGLARLATRLVAELGYPTIAVRTIDTWLEARARKRIPKLPTRVNHDAPASVVRFKRHPALYAQLPAAIARMGELLAKKADRKIAARGAFVACYESAIRAAHARSDPRASTSNTTFPTFPTFVSEGAPQARGICFEEHDGPSLQDSFRTAARALFRQDSSLRSPAARRTLEQTIASLGRVYDSLLLLLGDRDLLERAVATSAGALSASALEDLLRHTRRQLEDTDEKTFAHVDAARRTTLDGRPLDEGTPASIAGSLDQEDFALLLGLHRLAVGGQRPKNGVRWLVVDEAQELAPVELAALAGALAPSGIAIVAGDPGQQIDPTVDFAGWPAILRALEATESDTVHLPVGYRCPASVVRLAAKLRPSPGEPTPGGGSPVGNGGDRNGAPVLLSTVDGPGHRIVILSEVLPALLEREPFARIAILAGNAEEAAALFAVLRQAFDCGLVENGDFSFAPGIEVAAVAEVKGLEFDYVVIPDASAMIYPSTPDAKRRLYVAMTRAREQLWVIAPPLPSPLLIL
ncbi:MAG: ATP-binding domain-containing protein [Pseudomonadota bacterium]